MMTTTLYLDKNKIYIRFGEINAFKTNVCKMMGNNKIGVSF